MGSVQLAEYVGWLTFVDGRLVKLFLDSSAEIRPFGEESRRFSGGNGAPHTTQETTTSKFPDTVAPDHELAETTEPKPVPPDVSIESRQPDLISARPDRWRAYLSSAISTKAEVGGEEDLYIDGKFVGAISLPNNTLTIGPNADVDARISVRTVTVLGHLRGQVRASDTVELRRSGSLEADLTTARIVIEDGAVFRGSIDILQAGWVREVKSPATAETVAEGAKSAGAVS